MRLLVDGMNVIGSRPDRWWRDRRGAMRRLVASLERHRRKTGDEITVVLDSRAFEVEEQTVGVRFAPGGRNAGDDEIVRIVERDAAPTTLTVVTSDKDLSARVQALGASVTGSREFRDRLSDR
jgi:predicted RNA-binding protein with PIN domain